MSGQGDIVRQVEEMTADLLAVKKKIVLLLDMMCLLPAQKEAVASLLHGLDGLRGWELGNLRQKVGLDQDIARLNKRLRK